MSSDNKEGGIDKTFVYMDHNATTKPDPLVVKGVNEALEQFWGNPASTYDIGFAAKEALSLARKRVYLMLHPGIDEKHLDEMSQKTITFTSGGTESNTWAIFTSIQQANHQGAGDTPLPHIVSSTIEHPSILKVLSNYQALGKLTYTLVDPAKDGRLEVEHVLNAVRQDQTVIITLSGANNETGVIQPVEEIASSVKSAFATSPPLIHVDAAQMFGKLGWTPSPNIDMITIVGHKFYGPRCGALYHREGIRMTPLFHGGGQELGLRSGTPDVPYAVGLGIACNLVRTTDDKTKLDNLKSRFLSKLKLLPGVIIHFKEVEQLPNTVAISLPEELCRHSHDGTTVHRFSRLVCSSRSACHSGSAEDSPILVKSGLSSAQIKSYLRLSIGRGTTAREIDDAVEEIEQSLRGLQNLTE